MTDNKQVEGIGGWMALVAIGVWLNPLSMLITISNNHEIFKNGNWFYLTNPSLPDYTPGFSGLMVFEFTMTLLLFAMSLYLVWAMMKGKQSFPKVYILLIVLSLFYHSLGEAAASTVFPGLNFYDREYNSRMSGLFLVAVVWIPYMLMSVRVKNTFINEASNIHAAKAIGSMFVTFSLVFGIAAYNANQNMASQLQTESELEQDGFLQTLQTELQEFNAGLPVKVDESTNLDAVLFVDTTVTYRFTTIGARANDIDFDGIHDEMRNYLLSSVCEDGATMQILSHDLTLKYAYFDEYGDNMGNIDINKADCTN